MSNITGDGALAPQVPLPQLRAEFVYEALVEIGRLRALGPSPLGERRIVPILGGVFAGPKLCGKVLPGGADRQVVGADGARRLEALYELETDDGAVITVRNRVIIDDPAGAPRYARSSVVLAAPEGRYGWLNRRIFIGTLDSLAPKPQVLIRVFEMD